MKSKLFGTTSLQVSAIGQGTSGAGRNADTNRGRIKKREDTLRYGIELGMTFLDTGEHYEEGHAEEILGRVIQGNRHKVVISTKFNPAHNSYENVMSAVEGSMRRLKTEYIDLYQIQWPNPAIPVSETLDALLVLIEQEKIRYAGVSNLTVDQLREAHDLTNGAISSIQVEYNLCNRSIESGLIPYCEKNDITVIAYSPFSQGRQSFTDDEMALLRRLSDKYGATIPQIILSWIIRHPSVIAIIQTMDYKHTFENAMAANLNLDQQDIETIDRTFVRKTCLIPTDRIRLLHGETPEPEWIYNTLEKAIANRLSMQPGPIELAKDIQKNGMLKPIEIIPTTDNSGCYDYDLIHGQIRYWAWVIAYGTGQPILANIIQGHRVLEMVA